MEKLYNCYLALDISLSSTGYSVYYDGSFIEINSIPTSPKHTIEKRLDKIYEKMYEVVQKYDFNRVYIEEPYIHAGRPKSSMQIIRASKTVYYALGKGGIEFGRIKEIHNKTVKMHVTGNGKSTKEFVKQCVKRRINGYKFKNYDESDSVAVMLTGLDMEGLI